MALLAGIPGELDNLVGDLDDLGNLPDIRDVLRDLPRDVRRDGLDAIPETGPLTSLAVASFVLDVVPKPVEVFVVEIGAERRPVGSDVD